jgi:regulator of nucleoside diphosphate kinase
MTTKKHRLKPMITLLAADHERLTALAHSAMQQQPEVAAILNEELERAHVVPDGEHRKGIVCLGSDVEFRDDTTSTVRKVSLVLPGEADISRGKISVLTPVGTALIGLRAGQSIAWRTRSGQMKQLTVLQVESGHEHPAQSMNQI